MQAQSLDGAVINNNFATDAGIDPTTAIYSDLQDTETARPYLNIWVARAEDADNPVYAQAHRDLPLEGGHRRAAGGERRHRGGRGRAGRRACSPTWPTSRTWSASPPDAHPRADGAGSPAGPAPPARWRGPGGGGTVIAGPPAGLRPADVALRTGATVARVRPLRDRSRAREHPRRFRAPRAVVARHGRGVLRARVLSPANVLTLLPRSSAPPRRTPARP
ncbi:MetQ/NlpA family ABC transporter substrate-binding protein [Cellulomonas sp. Marseille-Q8402]